MSAPVGIASLSLHGFEAQNVLLVEVSDCKMEIPDRAELEKALAYENNDSSLKANSLQNP